MRKHWTFLTLIGLIVCFPIFIKTYFLTRVGIVLILIIINVTGMTLLTRYAGVVSLGHSAFYAMGAYLSAILTVKLHYNPWIAMVLAAGVTMACAYLFAIPFLRLLVIFKFPTTDCSALTQWATGTEGPHPLCWIFPQY